jgi:hypothetical protein
VSPPRPDLTLQTLERTATVAAVCGLTELETWAEETHRAVREGRRPADLDAQLARARDRLAAAGWAWDGHRYARGA